MEIKIEWVQDKTIISNPKTNQIILELPANLSESSCIDAYHAWGNSDCNINTVYDDNEIPY